MKLKVKSTSRYNNLFKETNTYFSLSSCSFCCEEMKDAFEQKFIVFGEHDCLSSINTDCHVNILHCCPYPEGACWYELPIKYCPFCQSTIEIKIFS